MDIKAKIEEIVAKIKGDDKLLDSFKSDPVKTVESLTGADLPDDIMDQIVNGVKAAISGGGVSGLIDKVKGLF